MSLREFTYRRPQKGEELPTIYVRLGFKSGARSELVKTSRAGLLPDALNALIRELAIPRADGLRLVGVSGRTLDRRIKDNQPLAAGASDRIYRVASVIEAATQLFDGDEALAKQWLKAPNRALSGDAPLERLDTAAGADEVKELIGKLERGTVI